MTTTNQPTTHRGSCHCGACTYEVTADTSAATRCNCSICNKVNQLSTSVKPDAFKLLTGEDKLGRYKWGPVGTRYFCTTCGVHIYGDGHLAELGGDFVSVNFQTLDDVDPRDVTVMYWDGRHDNWHAGPRDQPWPIFTGGASARSA